MSRRTNGTNRAGALLNASRYTGYGKPKKKTASLAELNGHINKNINSLIISRDTGGCNGKREPMELEGDMILGATIQYDATRDSGVFIIGDVKYSLLPRTLAVMAAALLKKHFSATDLAKAYADFYIAFLATVEVAREDSDEEETGKEN